MKVNAGTLLDASKELDLDVEAENTKYAAGQLR
jgi:hypothetical protein